MDNAMGIDSSDIAGLLLAVAESDLQDIYKMKVVYLEVVRDRLRDIEALASIANGHEDEEELDELFYKYTMI